MDKVKMAEKQWVAICRSPPVGFDKGRIGIIHFDDIKSVRWDNHAGGVAREFCKFTKRNYLYCYVDCTDIVLEVDHTCQHGPPPHEIKVCVVKKYTPKDLYNKLVESANRNNPQLGNMTTS